MKRLPTVKVKILKKTVANCKKVRPGDVIDLDPRTATTLINNKQAVEIKNTYLKSSPLISVIIPVYNDGEYLNDCIKSIKSQTYKNIEIIVVFDGKQDIPELYHKDLKILMLKENNGAPTARNVGAEEAKGDFLFFCDVDVELFPDCLDKMYQQYLKTQCEWVYSNYYLGEELHIYSHFSGEALKKCNICSTMSLIKRTAFPKFDKDLIRFQDWDLFLNMASKGYKGSWINQPLFRADERDGITRTTISNKEAKEIIYNKWGIE